MAEVAKGIIDIEINTGSAAQQLKALQQQINAFNLALNKGAREQSQFASQYSKDLQFAINRTGVFTAETVKLSTAAATLDKTLSKGKVSLGQFFSAKFNKNSAIAAETMALAAERAKRMQTQFIATSGAARGMQDALAVRPLAEFSSGLSIASQRSQLLSTMFKQGTTQLINFGKNVQWAGRQLMVGFTVPLTIFGNTAAKTFTDLEQAAIRFKRVYGDLFTTEAETARALKGIEDLAKSYTKYNIAVKDTINLAADLAAAGYQGAKLNEAIAQTNRLATLGNIDQQKSMSTIISLQNAFEISSKDLAGTINYLNSVENQTVVSLDDITEAIPRVAPVIKGLGGDVKDLTVFLAAMEEGGVSAEQGANALKSGLASLINPTKSATQTLAGFGINLNQIVETNKGDLMGTVRGLGEALATLSDFQKQQSIEAIFGKYQFARLGALFTNIVKEGSQANQVLQLASRSAIELAYTANKELGAVENAVSNKFKAAIEDLKVSIAPIGEIFLKVSIPVLNFLEKIVEKFNGLSEGRKQFIAIATIITGIVIPAGTMFFGLLMNLVGTLLKLSQGFGAFTKGFLTGGPIGAIKALSQSSKYLSLAEIDAAMAAQQLSTASQAVNAAFIQQVGAAGAAQGAINSLTRAYMDLIATQSSASKLPAFATAGLAATKSRKYASGVVSVPGSGNRDTVPAMLTPGEAVIPAAMAKKYAPLIGGMVSGNIPGYADGYVPTYGEYGVRLQSASQNMGRMSGNIGSYEQILSPMAMRIGEARGIKPTVSNVQRGLMDDIAVEYESIVKQFTQNLNNEFDTTFSSIRDTDERFKMAWKAAGTAVEKEVNAISNEVDKGVVRKTFGLDEDFYGSAPTMPRREGGAGLERARRSIFNIRETGVRSYLTIGKAAKSLFERRTGEDASGFQMGHVNNPKMQDMSKLSQDPKLSNAMKRALSTQAVNMVNDVEKATAQAQQSSSPAERSAKLGDEWSKGYAQGISRSGEKAARAAEDVIKVTDKRASQQANALGATPSMTRGTTATSPLIQAKDKEIKQSNRVSQSARSLSGGLFATSMAVNALGVGMMAAGGNVGEFGQKLLTMSSTVSAFSALLPILSNPIGALTVAIVGVVAAVKMHKDMQEKAAQSIRDAAQKQADAMTGSALTVSEFGKAVGMQSMSQKAQQRRLGGEQASIFFQALTGEDMASTLSGYREARSKGNVAGLVAADVQNLALQYSFSPKDVESYISAVAEAMGDYTLNAEIRAELVEMLYSDPNTKKDLLKDPSIPIDIVSQIKTNAGNAQGAMAMAVSGNLGSIDQVTANIQKQSDLVAKMTENAKAVGYDSAGKAARDLQMATDYNQRMGLSKAMGLIGLGSTGTLATAQTQAQGGKAYATQSIANVFTPKEDDVQRYNDVVNVSKEYSNLLTQMSANSNILFKDMDNQRTALELLKQEYESTEMSMDTYLLKAGEINQRQQSLNDAYKQQYEAAKAAGGTALEDFVKSSSSLIEIQIAAMDTTQGLKDKYKEFADEVKGNTELEVNFNLAFKNFDGSLEDFLIQWQTLKDKFEDDVVASQVSVWMSENSIDIEYIDSLSSALAGLPEETLTKLLVDGELTDAAREALNAAYFVQTYGAETAAKLVANKEGYGPVNKDNYSFFFKDRPGKVPSTGKGNKGDKDAADGSGGGGASKNWQDYLMNRFEITDKRLADQIKQYQDVIDLQQRQNELDQRSIDLNQRGLDQLSKEEDALNKRYDERISLLDGVADSNNRLKEQEASRISLAKALAEGNVSTAAQIMGQMTANEANYRIEDTRAALEKQREEDLKNIKVEVNGQLLTRQQIEENIDSIEENIYQRNLKVRDAQDQIYNIEQQRLTNSREREKIETKLYMLEQRKAILELQRMKVGKGGLTKEQAGFLSEYKSSYNTMVDYFNSTFGESLQRVMYGGMIKKFAIGGNVPGKGNIDRVPALLTPGEFVVRKSAAQANMPLLEMINNGIFPKLGGPSYNVPDGSVGVGSTSVTNSVMYNDTYNINVNVAGTNASPEDIANVVMSKMSQQNRGSVRGIRY